MVRPDAIELKLLHAFTVLADDLNFGRAAARLHVTQPALSARIRQLEERLGFPLFARSTRRVDLTPQGVALVAPARRLLAESARFVEAAEAARGRPERRLIFGAALYTLSIPERQQLLDAFFERHPDVPVTVLPTWQREMARMLLRGEADLALMLGAPAPLAAWEAERAAEVIFPDALPRLVLRREPAGLLVPRESPLAGLDPIPPERLEGLRVAMLGSTHGRRILDPVRDVLDAAGAETVVPPEPHGIGVERYGRQFRIPAVTLGWFGTGGSDDPDMVRRPVQGLHLVTELALVRSPVADSAATELLWREAQARFAGSEEPAGLA
jgi:DNA-binding transcriptional LysR family regulator